MGKRFLLIGPLPPPIGGDTIFNLLLTRSRLWEQYGVKLITLDTSPKGGLKLPEDRLKLADLVRGIKVLFKILKLTPQVDFILIWSNTRFVLTMGPLIHLLASIFRKQVAVWLFSTYFVKRFNNSPAIWRSIVRRFLNGSRFIFCQTHLLEKLLLKELNIRGDNMIFFPNFVRDNEIISEVGRSKFEGRCVYLGQIKREKGVFDIITAIGGNSNYRCDFYGPVHDRDRDKFISLTEKYDNIRYMGEVEREKVIETISKYDIFLFPSYHPSEGYPAVIFESYASATPVIASNWLALPEIVRDRETGLIVPPRKPGAILKALDWIRDNEEMYQKMKIAALKFAQEHSESKIIGEVLIGNLISALRDS